MENGGYGSKPLFIQSHTWIKQCPQLCKVLNLLSYLGTHALAEKETLEYARFKFQPSWQDKTASQSQS